MFIIKRGGSKSLLTFMSRNIPILRLSTSTRIQGKQHMPLIFNEIFQYFAPDLDPVVSDDQSFQVLEDEGNQLYTLVITRYEVFLNFVPLLF